MGKAKRKKTTSHGMKKVYLFGLIASLVASALVAITIFLLGTFGWTEVRLLLTTLAIGAFSLAGLACTTLVGVKKFEALVFLGITVTIAGLLTAIGLIWDVLTGETWSKTFVILTVLSYATAHGSLLLLIASKKPLVIMARNATLLFIAVVALMLVYLVLAAADGVDESFYRFLGVFAVLDVLGTIVTPMLKKYYS